MELTKVPNPDQQQHAHPPEKRLNRLDKPNTSPSNLHLEHLSPIRIGTMPLWDECVPVQRRKLEILLGSLRTESPKDVDGFFCFRILQEYESLLLQTQKQEDSIPGSME